jgi:hypothetical protein
MPFIQAGNPSARLKVPPAMDAFTILLLGGTVAIWTAMLSAVTVRTKAPRRRVVRAEGLEPPRT